MRGFPPFAKRSAGSFFKFDPFRGALWKTKAQDSAGIFHQNHLSMLLMLEEKVFPLLRRAAKAPPLDFIKGLTENLANPFLIYPTSKEELPMKKYWQLFITFARIGLFTIGGGYAMLPMMQSELVERHGWATEQEMMDYYALAQCTPGAIAVNVSTFIGYKIAGVLGGVIATLGLVFPSLVIIIAIAAVLGNVSELPAVKNAFAGIRVGVAVLMINSVIKLARAAIVDWKAVLIFLAVFGGAVFTPVSPMIYIVAAGVAGILLKTWEVKAK